MKKSIKHNYDIMLRGEKKAHLDPKPNKNRDLLCRIQVKCLKLK